MILTTKKAAHIAKFAEFVWFVWLCSNVQTVEGFFLIHVGENQVLKEKSQK